MKRFFCILYFIVCCITVLQAQVSFSVSVPSRVRQGDKFPVTFRLRNAQGTSLSVPEIEGCTRLYGPSVSTSQSTQIVNGKTSSSMTIDYTYYYRADKAGTCHIAEASISADGKQLKSQATSFTIVASNTATQTTDSNVDIDNIDTQSSDRKVSDSDVFVRIILARSSVFEQEAVECEIKLYTKYGINSFIPTKQPAFDNFLVEELDITSQLNVEELYNGERYMTATLKKCILYPQKPGKLTINSGNYDVTVIQYDNINMGLFNVRQPRERQIKITSNTTSLTAKSLPEPRPAGFSGAVGRFSAESRIIGNNFKSGDPASLIYTIKGTGNIKYLKEPVIDFPSQFEVYTPTSNVNTSVVGNNVTGTMSVDYTFIPQTPGDFVIPATPFVYFNPDDQRYVTIETDDYHLHVAKGNVNRISSAPDQDDIAAQNNDIRYISTSHQPLSLNHTPIVCRAWFWCIPTLALAIFIVSVILNRRALRNRADMTSLRLAKANKIAQKRLKAAKNALDAGKIELFYDEMLRALWGYFSDKLSMPVSSLSRDNISSSLVSRGIPQELAEKVITLIDECEMAKYAPAVSSEEMRAIYQHGSRIIDHIESYKLNKSR